MKAKNHRKNIGRIFWAIFFSNLIFSAVDFVSLNYQLADNNYRVSISNTVKHIIPSAFAQSSNSKDYIRPYSNNPAYWQYKGKPVMLLGMTDDTAIFNYPIDTPTIHFGSTSVRGDRVAETLPQHFQRMVDHGGNYARCTMSWRMPGEGNVFPYLQDNSGKFDLNQKNPEYWTRFEYMLSEALTRDIIIHIELFDPFNYYHDSSSGISFGWSINPFNPSLNINYTLTESGLPTSVTSRPSEYSHPFFQTASGMSNYKNGKVWGYQLDFLDEILNISIKYPNVLYTIYNEGHEIHQPKQWADAVSAYIRGKAGKVGVPVYVGLMPYRETGIMHSSFLEAYDDPANYQFVDISQGNNIYSSDDVHWNNIMSARARLKATPGLNRPLTSVKIYGFGVSSSWRKDYNQNYSWTGGTSHAVNRNFRNILGGVSTSRWHRWSAGLGATVDAEYITESSRMLVNEINIFSCEPDADFSLFSNRRTNQVFGCKTNDNNYAIYAALSGNIYIRLAQGEYELRWLDVMNSQWLPSQKINGNGESNPVTITAPGATYAAVLTNRLPRLAPPEKMGLP